MAKLRPFEALEVDYYMGDEAHGGGWRDSEEELSSDDELQQELCKLSGIKRDCIQRRREEKPFKSEFENDMECELDQLITNYANEHLSGNVKRVESTVASNYEVPRQRKEVEMAASIGNVDDNTIEKETTSESDVAIPKKRVKVEAHCGRTLPVVEEMEIDSITPSTLSANESRMCTQEPSPASVKNEHPEGESSVSELTVNAAGVGIREETNPIKETAKQSIEEAKKLPDFYDPDEDEHNEKWMQQQRKLHTGSGDVKSIGEARPRIDGNSDAVLSCPGCMVMLTRDCQRHEIYNDQYRAIFVENCRIEGEQQTIEKTGKEKRRERQKLRKMGLNPAEQTASPEDIFLPVRCAVCSTNVAFMDHDEVYHFFNVLSGYA